MVNYKKYICFLVSLLMILSLTACGPEDANAEAIKSTPVLEQTAAPTDMEQNTVENSTIKAQLISTPAHISKVYSDNFAVEADVHVPNVNKADILLAKYMQFDEQKLLSLFYNGETPQRKISSVDNTVMFSDSHSNLNINNGDISFITQDYANVKYPTDSFVVNSAIFSAQKRFGEVYTCENLDFMTRLKAFETVSDVLQQLSLNVMNNAEIYAIDSKTMQTQQDERIQKEIDTQKKMGVSPIQNPTDGYQTKDTYTQDDDFYILYFTMMQNGIPVTQKSYTIQASDRALNGSTTRVSFSKSGIIELRCNGIYQQQGIAESPSTLIPVETALQKAYEKQNVIISTDKVTVTAIDLEYVPVPYNTNYDEVKLIPAWSLTMSYERSMPSNDGTETAKTRVINRMVFINAVTGEEIK